MFKKDKNRSNKFMIHNFTTIKDRKKIQ